MQRRERALDVGRGAAHAELEAAFAFGEEARQAESFTSGSRR
jgi:hypothetical protein